VAQQLCQVELPDPDLEYLQSCARIRHISTVRLVTRLIRTIARDQLVLSVLDDESKPDKPEPGTRYHRSKLFRDC
jgi:hypothetical protein